MKAIPATFTDFLGNTPAVESLRGTLAAGRLPPALILAGPEGVGKYTLALMLTMTAECERQPRDLWSNGQSLAGFCGVCRNCTRIGEAADLEASIARAVEAREELRDADRKETRILIQPHPDVVIVPPDPPQLLIKLGQIRTLIQRAPYVAAEAPRKIFLLTSGAMMKEAANSLLKLLEEPPSDTHLILLTENVAELLPTIRSRCALVRLGAVPTEEIETLLAERRPQLNPPQRALVARLSQGAPGRALAFDLETYIVTRKDALLMLQNSVGDPDHGALFRMTETYRAGAEGQTRTVAMLRTLALLLEDLLLLIAGTPELLHNIDLRPEMERMAEQLSFSWLERAVRGMDAVYAGMRRNLLRSLALDSFAGELAEVAR